MTDPKDSTEVTVSDPAQIQENTANGDGDAATEEATDTDVEPVENAIDIATQLLRDGREVQKISVVRNLPDLLRAHPEECLQRVLPIVQESLVDTSSLDLHCEGAIAYRNIITAHDLGLSLHVLKAILDNLEAPHDSLAGAAWFETLLDVVEHLPIETLRTEVVPVAGQQIQQSKPIQRRVSAAKLVEKLANRLTLNEIKTDLIPCVQALCQDVSSHVRNSMCEKLPNIAKTMSSEDCQSLLLPSLVELSIDEDTCVRQTTVDAVTHMIPLFAINIHRELLVPLIQKIAEKSLQTADNTLPTVAKQFGPWMHALASSLTKEQYSWFLSFFCRISCIGRAQAIEMHKRMSRSDPEGFTLQESFESDPVATACRHWAAYNFPAVLQTAGPSQFKQHLTESFHGLCTDPDEAIRRTMAAGFHEITQIFQHHHENASSLLRSFIELIRAGDADTVLRLTGNLHSVLPVLYESFVPVDINDNNKDMLDAEMIGQRNQLNRIILACNRLMRGTSNWRGHESLLTQLSCLRGCVDQDDMHTSFIPMLKEEILTARAIPCRIAAVRTFLLFLRETTSRFQRHKMMEYLIQTLCFHQSCHKRMLYLDACSQILKLFSRHFFVKYFLQDTLKLADDRVACVRHKLCKLLPDIKKTLVLPEDQSNLSAVEGAMRTMFNKNQNKNQRNTTQNSAMVLSQTDTSGCSDQDDHRKVQEEIDKFGSPPRESNNQENESNTKPRMPTTLRISPVRTQNSNSTPKSPSPPKQASPPRQKIVSSSKTSPPPQNTRPPMVQGSSIRIQRPIRTAVVRPQPKALVSRSPSPRPTKENEFQQKNNGNGSKNGSLRERKNRMTTSADYIDDKRDRVMIRPPTPVRRKAVCEETGVIRDPNGNPERSSSMSRITKPVTPVRDSIERWQNKGESASNPNIVLMKRSLEKRYYGPSATIHDANNNSSSKTGIPLSTSSSSSSIFSRQGPRQTQLVDRRSSTPTNYALTKSASAINSRGNISYATVKRHY